MFTMVIFSIEVYRSRSVDVTKRGWTSCHYFGHQLLCTLPQKHCLIIGQFLSLMFFFFCWKFVQSQREIYQHLASCFYCFIQVMLCNASNDLSLAVVKALDLMHSHWSSPKAYANFAFWCSFICSNLISSWSITTLSVWIPYLVVFGFVAFFYWAFCCLWIIMVMCTSRKFTAFFIGSFQFWIQFTNFFAAWFIKLWWDFM